MATSSPAQESSAVSRIGDYITTEKLGSGSFGDVFKAYHQTTKEVVAIKVLNIRRLLRRGPKAYDNLEKEISIQRKIVHKNIVRLYNVLKSKRYIYLVLEYCGGGDLNELILNQGPLSEADSRALLGQLADGLKFLWTNEIIHRDLKPHNLLLSEASPNGTLKIADFGFARHLSMHDMAQSHFGSPLYMAPEVLSRQKYDAKADLWSVGCILYQMLTRRTPYTTRATPHFDKDLLYQIRSKALDIPEGIALSPACQQLLQGLLQPDPIMRISYKDFFRHPFLRASKSGEPEEGKEFVGRRHSTLDRQPLGLQAEGASFFRRNSTPVGQGYPSGFMASGSGSQQIPLYSTGPATSMGSATAVGFSQSPSGAFYPQPSPHMGPINSPSGTPQQSPVLYPASHFIYGPHAAQNRFMHLPLPPQIPPEFHEPQGAQDSRHLPVSPKHHSISASSASESVSQWQRQRDAASSRSDSPDPEGSTELRTPPRVKKPVAQSSSLQQLPNILVNQSASGRDSTEGAPFGAVPPSPATSPTVHEGHRMLGPGIVVSGEC